MQRMHFCSGAVFVTGDDIASSLLHYTSAVAMFRRSDVVTIPVVSTDGGYGTVTLLLNRSSQLSAESVQSDGTELRDEALVNRLDELTRSLDMPTEWDEFDLSELREEPR